MDCRDSALFAGVDEQSCRNMLTCFGAYERRFTAGQTILVCGEQQEMIGVLLVPGNRFELPGGARLGYCAPEPVLREGLARLGRALRQFD